jgi:hypothetical protein
MDRLNRYFKREKEKNKNKLMPHVVQSTVASRESFIGGSPHSGASFPSHSRASINPTAAQRDVIGAVNPDLSNATQWPGSELRIERGGLDTEISRLQSLPDTTISKQAHFTYNKYI